MQTQNVLSNGLPCVWWYYLLSRLRDLCERWLLPLSLSALRLLLLREELWDELLLERRLLLECTDHKHTNLILLLAVFLKQNINQTACFLFIQLIVSSLCGTGNSAVMKNVNRFWKPSAVNERICSQKNHWEHTQFALWDSKNIHPPSL